MDAITVASLPPKPSTYAYAKKVSTDSLHACRLKSAISRLLRLTKVYFLAGAFFREMPDKIMCHFHGYNSITGYFLRFYDFPHSIPHSHMLRKARIKIIAPYITIYE